jgi:DNA polymerase-4
MDAFFASVELLRYPELRGLPLVIGGRGDPREPGHARGVVATATYEARAFGIRSGMPMREALRRCPQARFLPVDFAAYTPVSARFKAVMRACTPLLEDRGIDEAYLDISDLAMSSLEVARSLKAGILEATGLTCSVGIAPAKVLAKMASDLDKPDGISILGEPDLAHDLRERIWPLPARSLPGVGPRTGERLTAAGITTVGELAAAPPAWLAQQFGPSHASWLHEAANGRDERGVVTEREPRSRSAERTFAEDISDLRELARRIGALCIEVAEEITREGYAARTVGIKLRFADFVTCTRDLSFANWTQDVRALRRAAFECMKRVEIDRPVRLVGVRVSELRRVEGAGEAPIGPGMNQELDFGP